MTTNKTKVRDELSLQKDRKVSILNKKTYILQKDGTQRKQARKGFRPISASEVLLVRKVNNLINKRTEHWSCRIFVQQVK